MWLVLKLTEDGSIFDLYCNKRHRWKEAHFGRLAKAIALVPLSCLSELVTS